MTGVPWLQRERAEHGAEQSSEHSCVLCHIYQVEILLSLKQPAKTPWPDGDVPDSGPFLYPLNCDFSCNFNFEPLSTWPHCFHLNSESSLTHFSSGFLQSDFEHKANLARCYVHSWLHLTLSHSQLLLQSFWSQVKNPAWLSSYKLELLWCYPVWCWANTESRLHE